MDFRKEPRLEADTPVQVSVLDDTETTFSAVVMNVSGKGARLIAGRSISPGIALKMEGDDFLLLGQVIYCEPHGDAFALGVELEHALYHTSELARLMAQYRETTAAEAEEHF